MLLPWRSSRRRIDWTAQQGLVENPPCDLGVIKHTAQREIRTVLVAARGGPHARLALRVAEGIAASTGAVLTLLHINPEHWDEDRRAMETGFFSAVVERWCAKNTFHSSEFRNLSHLVDLKRRQGTSVSLALPTLNEEQTVGKIVSSIKKHLIERFPLVDEFVVIDSGSEDRTVEI